MVKRTAPHVKSEIDKLNEKETAAVAVYISQLLASRAPKSYEPPSSDDLIVSLSEKTENRRARQVFEWEKTRRQNQPRTA